MIDEVRALRRTANVNVKWNLSALALIAGAGGAGHAMADTASSGGVTVDLQGEYGFQGKDLSTFADPQPGLSDPTIGPGGKGYDMLGSITYQAPGSDISFILGVQYGKTNSRGRTFHSSYTTNVDSDGEFGYGSFSRDAHVSHSQSHYVVDFDIGKDVGVGLFGRGVSTLGGGIRYAHFSATTRGNFSTNQKYFHETSSSAFFQSGQRGGKFSISRKNDAVGPNFFIKQTSLLPGQMGDAGFSLGWGANIGVLFGRQTEKTTVDITNFHSFHTSTFFSSDGESGKSSKRVPSGLRKPLSAGTRFYAPVNSGTRSRSSTTVDFSAFFQMSWQAPKSPLSVGVGYRFEDFFNALDGGTNDIPHQIDFKESGPYLDVSFKLP